MTAPGRRPLSSPGAEVSDPARALFDEDLAEVGFVMNTSRLWAYQPEASRNLFGLMSQ